MAFQQCCNPNLFTSGISTELDPATPIGNFSSEEPDQDLYIGTHYGGGDPFIGTHWESEWCLGVCVSTVSQQDADDCAQRNSIFCIGDNDDCLWCRLTPNPDPNPGPDDPPLIPVDYTIYLNTDQSCVDECPDGEAFTYTVPAGTYAGLSQAAADAIAASVACNRAIENQICLGELDVTKACVGSEYLGTVSISAGGRSVNTTLIDGVLPTGLDVTGTDTEIVIGGTPLTEGPFSFTLEVEDALGNFMQKVFTIDIIGITQDSLPDANNGVAYSQTLTAAGPVTAPVTWLVSSGALPDGLALNPSTGEIAGTPTTNGDFAFTVLMTDADKICTKALSITVVAAACCLVNSTNIALASKAGGVAYATVDNRVFAGMQNGNVVVIDVATDAIVGTIVGVGTQLGGFIYSPINDRIYCNDLGVAQQIVILNPNTMAVAGTIPFDAATFVLNNPCYDATNNLIYYTELTLTSARLLVLNPVAGTLSVLITETPVAPATFQFGMRAAYCPTSDRIYIPVAHSDGLGTITEQMWVYTTAGFFQASVTLAGSTSADGSEAIFYSADNDLLYYSGSAAHLNAGGISIFDPADNSKVTGLVTSNTPWWVEFDSQCLSACVLGVTGDFQQWNLSTHAFICTTALATALSTAQQMTVSTDGKVYSPNFTATTLNVLSPPP